MAEGVDTERCILRSHWPLSMVTDISDITVVYIPQACRALEMYFNVVSRMYCISLALLCPDCLGIHSLILVTDGSIKTTLNKRETQKSVKKRRKDLHLNLFRDAIS